MILWDKNRLTKQGSTPPQDIIDVVQTIDRNKTTAWEYSYEFWAPVFLCSFSLQILFIFDVLNIQEGMHIVVKFIILIIVN